MTNGMHTKTGLPLRQKRGEAQKIEEKRVNLRILVLCGQDIQKRGLLPTP